jgi:hypothetical protein
MAKGSIQYYLYDGGKKGDKRVIYGTNPSTIRNANMTISIDVALENAESAARREEGTNPSGTWLISRVNRR